MLSNLATPNDHVYGVGEAHPTVIHYGDYRSVESARLHEAIQEIVDDDDAPFRYVFRYLPSLGDHGPSSVDSTDHDLAIAAEAAAKQGQFWEMHEALFRFAAEPEIVTKAAKAIGLDMNRFARDCESREIGDSIEQHVKYVSETEIDRVPTLLIRGKEYLGAWDAESLQEAIFPPVARQVEQVATKFAEWAAASGAILIIFAVVALLWCNSPFGNAYQDLWHLNAGFVFAGQSLVMSLHHWVNDFLMAIFFLVVGLELKRELLSGELSDPRSAVVPAAAAVGGMLIPAIIYLVFNLGAESSRGWGVPMATDIAFTLGVLALLGRRVPTSMIIFATALAVVDDLGAILVLAIFYNHGIAWEALGMSSFLMLVLVGLNRARVYAIWPYLAVGLVLWAAVYFSGLHATLAGVLLAATIPTRPKVPLRPLLVQEASVARESRRLLKIQKTNDAVERKRFAERTRIMERRLNPPAERMESALQPWSSFFVLPLFALANAGIIVSAGSISSIDRVSLGIFAGLVVGKPAGIVLATWLVVKLGLGNKPSHSTWVDVVGVGFLCGIGFTMSIFISTEAFIADEKIATAKLAVMVASVLAAVCGVLWFRMLKPIEQRAETSN